MLGAAIAALTEHIFQPQTMRPISIDFMLCGFGPYFNLFPRIVRLGKLDLGKSKY
jgi:hypothetical protein